MASRKPKPITASKTPSNATRVTKAKAKNGTSNAPAVPCRVKRYRNGILNLERTPTHLVAVVALNAAESPLLRLPPEIRNKIWSFAMGGQTVKFPWSQPFCKGRAVSTSSNGPADLSFDNISNSFPYRTDINVTKLPSAFHLPEVCRQIYSETALTTYRHNTFIIEIAHTTSRNSLVRLMAVQRRAIASVILGPNVLCRHLRSDFFTKHKPLTHKIPNLAIIVITEAALQRVEFMYKNNSMSNIFEEKPALRAHIVQKLQAVYGDGLEVQFEEEHGS